jgi:hypothetical protein
VKVNGLWIIQAACEAIQVFSVLIAGGELARSMVDKKMPTWLAMATNIPSVPVARAAFD